MIPILEYKELLEELDIKIGDWQFTLKEFPPDDPTHAWMELISHDDHTLYGFVGSSLHGVQQMIAEITFKGLEVYAQKMSDTDGSPVVKETILIVGGLPHVLGLLCDDTKLEWKP